MIQGNFKVSKRSLKGVSRQFQDWFRGILSVFKKASKNVKGSFMEVSKVFQRNFREISRGFQESLRVFQVVLTLPGRGGGGLFSPP